MGWCYDWYDWYVSTSSETVIDPAGASSGNLRVIRGGSWGSSAYDASVSYRYCTSPSNQSFGLGFRVVRNATTE